MNKFLPCLLTVLALLLPRTGAVGQSLTYQLLSDSTFTPASGGIPTGPAQPMTGSFTWVQHLPSGFLNSDAFTITNLSFKSTGYTLTLGSGEEPESPVMSSPGGHTYFSINVNWSESNTNPWSIIAWADGTFSGPANAPTNLTFTSEGFYSPANGANYGLLYIHAQLGASNITTNPPPPPPATNLVAGVQIAQSVQISWPTVANQTYQVQYASSPAPNAWTNLRAPIIGNGATMAIFDDGSQPGRFYRVLTF